MNALAQRASAVADRDGQIILASALAIVTLAITFASLAMIDSAKTSQAESDMLGTLTKMHLQQKSFHMVNARFAYWRELATDGARLPAGQRVVRSNADASHWYVSIENSDAGVVCDRTGELLDASGFEHKSTCRSATP